MEEVLFNELLYRNGEVEIYKTFDVETNLYGLYTPADVCGKCLDAAYRHIFPFSMEGRAVAITKNGEYVWLTIDYKESKMAQDDSLLWSAVYVNNSICNCVQNIKKVAGCKLCKGGVIFNKLNFRKFEEGNGLITYEYETLLNTYKIELTSNFDYETPMVDYVWEIDKFEAGVMHEINNHEEQRIELKDHSNICLLESTCHGISLTFHLMKLTIVDTAIMMEPYKEALVMGYDEFVSQNKKNRHQ